MTLSESKRVRERKFPVKIVKAKKKCMMITKYVCMLQFYDVYRNGLNERMIVAMKSFTGQEIVLPNLTNSN